MLHQTKILEGGTVGKITPSQTKSLECVTKDDIRISKEALFKGVSTRFGLRYIEKSIENPDVIFCYAFQNLRLGSIKINQRFRVRSRSNVLSPESSTHFIYAHRTILRQLLRTIERAIEILFILPKSSFGEHKNPRLGSIKFGRMSH